MEIWAYSAKMFTTLQEKSSGEAAVSWPWNTLRGPAAASEKRGLAIPVAERNHHFISPGLMRWGRGGGRFRLEKPVPTVLSLSFWTLGGRCRSPYVRCGSQLPRWAARIPTTGTHAFVMSSLPHRATVALVCLTNTMWQKWWYDTSEIMLCKTLWLPCWSLTFPLGSLALGEARCHVKWLYGDAQMGKKWDLPETTELQLRLNPPGLLEPSNGWSCSQQLVYNLMRDP